MGGGGGEFAARDGFLGEEMHVLAHLCLVTLTLGLHIGKLRRPLELECAAVHHTHHEGLQMFPFDSALSQSTELPLVFA